MTNEPRPLLRALRAPAWIGLAIAFASACDGGAAEAPTPDAAVDDGCDAATVLPSNYRLIPMVSTGAVQVATANNVTTGTIDATAGGLANAADNPYVYVDLRMGKKVDINDLDAMTSTTWDVAIKRSSLRVNGGDSGAGGLMLAVVQAATLGAVTAAPASGYVADDFTTTDCMLDAIPGGEPKSAFGEWYDYDVNTHAVTPRPEVYVIQRGDGTRPRSESSPTTATPPCRCAAPTTPSSGSSCRRNDTRGYLHHGRDVRRARPDGERCRRCAADARR